MYIHTYIYKYTQKSHFVSNSENKRILSSFLLLLSICVALRGAATLKARALKDVWNIASVIPVDKGIGVGGNNGSSHSSNSDELIPEDNFLDIASRELLSRGCELLKRTRQGNL